QLPDRGQCLAPGIGPQYFAQYSCSSGFNLACSAVVLSDQILIKRLSFSCFPKLTFNVNFQICFCNRLEWYNDAPAGSIINNHVVVFNSDNVPAKISLISNRRAGFQLCLATGKSFVIRQLIESTLESRR